MTTHNIPTWVLVADAARARLFRYDDVRTAIEPLKEWEHPGSRAKNQDLVTDRPGRTNQPHLTPKVGHGSGSAMEAELSPKETEQEVFARLLASELARGLSEHAYGRLILVANPRFLGMLRRVADEQVRKHIVSSVSKDYTMLPVRELEQQLAPVMHA
jgi:protein required for attachment to host cells